MLVYCWPAVYDVGPIVNQHRVDVSCLLGAVPIIPSLLHTQKVVCHRDNKCYVTSGGIITVYDSSIYNINIISRGAYHGQWKTWHGSLRICSFRNSCLWLFMSRRSLVNFRSNIMNWAVLPVLFFCIVCEDCECGLWYAEDEGQQSWLLPLSLSYKLPPSIYSIFFCVCWLCFYCWLSSGCLPLSAVADGVVVVSCWADWFSWWCHLKSMVKQEPRAIEVARRVSPPTNCHRSANPVWWCRHPGSRQRPAITPLSPS